MEVNAKLCETCGGSHIPVEAKCPDCDRPFCALACGTLHALICADLFGFAVVRPTLADVQEQHEAWRDYLAAPSNGRPDKT